MICLVKRQLPYVEKIHQFCPVIQFCFIYIHLGAVARQFFRGFLKFSQPHLDKKNLKNQFSKNQVLGGFGSKSFAQNSFGSMSFGFWVLAQNLPCLLTIYLAIVGQAALEARAWPGILMKSKFDENILISTYFCSIC